MILYCNLTFCIPGATTGNKSLSITVGFIAIYEKAQGKKK